MLVYIYQYILVLPALSVLSGIELSLKSVSGYNTVQGSIRKYPKVQYPRYNMVQEGTRPCTALYCLVLPCMVSFRGTGNLGTVLILQCTALYHVVTVSTDGFQRKFRSESTVRAGIYQNMLVYTSIYCYIPACTSIHR